MTESVGLLTVAITAGVSAGSALISVVITYILTRRREHEADWRKLKLGQYQEFILALSGIVSGRATPESHRRYADAVNSMALIAPPGVLKALRKFQLEISYINNNRSDEHHDQLLDVLLREMRRDIEPNPISVGADFSFHLFGLPPEAHSKELST
jgi:hypothetical protein